MSLLPADTIVLVSGLPRSGTSMAMRMLEAGGLPILSDGKRAADEDNPQGYFEDERVKRLAKEPDKSWIAEARGRVLKVVSPLLQHLPAGSRFKVIFMNRSLREVLASQAKMLARRQQASDISDEQMAKSFETHLGKVRAFLSSRPEFEVLELRHEAVIRDPLAAAKQMSAFLGVTLDVDKMAAAVDDRLYRNRG